MRIAIFGGSFDPVHKEHIALVQAAIQLLRLDKVFIVPAYAPPHKPEKKLAPDFHRLQMCRLAFEHLKQVEISDYEICQKGTSYTYLTCEYFHSLYPNATLYFLVGTDMLRDFPTWKYPERILAAATLAVCARAEKDGWLQKERQAFFKKFSQDFQVIDYNASPVSSTEIRVLAGAGMRLTPHVSEKVEAYIRENKLYAIPNAPNALALEKESRQQHSLRVALAAAKRAQSLGVAEEKAITAALFHDCAKNVDSDSELLQGFMLDEKHGEVPQAVCHQFQGAYIANRAFGIQDEDVLNAIAFHTSGRAGMSALEKLIFLSDMVEDGRNYQGVEILREMFYDVYRKGADGLDKCLLEALKQTVEYLEKKGEYVYPLTKKAYAYYQNQ